jgi:hypothetical protein
MDVDSLLLPLSPDTQDYRTQLPVIPQVMPPPQLPFFLPLTPGTEIATPLDVFFWQEEISDHVNIIQERQRVELHGWNTSDAVICLLNLLEYIHSRGSPGAVRVQFVAPPRIESCNPEVTLQSFLCTLRSDQPNTPRYSVYVVRNLVV